MPKKKKVNKNAKRKIITSSHDLAPEMVRSPDYWNALIKEFGEEKVMYMEGVSKKQLDKLRGAHVSFGKQLRNNFNKNKQTMGVQNKKVPLWKHDKVGTNENHFERFRQFISEVFAFGKALETDTIKVVAECVNEDEETTSYLVTCEGTGIDAGKWSGEFMVETGVEQVSICDGDDTQEVTPEVAKDIILFQMLYGYSE